MGALPIVERLRRKRALLHDGDRLESVLTLTNPDGPEAAELIAELYEALDMAAGLICVGGVTFKQMTDARTRIDAVLAKARGDQ